MELNSIDYLLYKYPDNPITKTIVFLVFSKYGFDVPWDQENIRIEWIPDFGAWYITLILDGYDNELVASMNYLSAESEDNLRFQIIGERGNRHSKMINVPLTFIKITEIPNE